MQRVWFYIETSTHFSPLEKCFLVLSEINIIFEIKIDVNPKVMRFNVSL